jgi:Zn finger protein HypA/HybF involved in hydrogenase expression
VHEVGLVAELVDAALEHAAGRAIALVRVRRATTVPEDVFLQAWEMLVPGTPLDGVALEVEPFEVRLVCPCGFDGVLEHDDVIGPGQVVCPSCGQLRGVPPTAELELTEVRTHATP